MGKNGLYKSIKLRHFWDAETWLRLLVERPLSNLNGWGFCGPCLSVSPCSSVQNGVSKRCGFCGRDILFPNKGFWQRVSNYIKRAYRSDKTLFARIKAECQGYPAPNLSEPLAWINDAWRKAQKPRGRQPGVLKRFFIVQWIEFLRLEPLMGQISEALDSLDGPGPPKEPVFPTMMSEQAALDLLRDGMAPDSFDGDPRIIAETFREQYRKRFGEEPYLGDDREIKRILFWVKRYRADPDFRLKGEKLRQK